jgi:hypothetical protein
MKTKQKIEMLNYVRKMTPRVPRRQGQKPTWPWAERCCAAAFLSTPLEKHRSALNVVPPPPLVDSSFLSLFLSQENL